MIQPDPSDADYTEHTIVGIYQYPDGRYEINYGFIYSYEATDGVAPQIGETVRIYNGLGPGSVRGLVVGGRVYEYRTRSEVEAEDEARRAQHDTEARKRFPEYDRRYEALPEPFRRRLDVFRRNPRFRLDLEGAELQLCELAIRLADECGSAEAVSRFQELPYELQGLDRSWLIENRESPEALDVVCQLAFWWLYGPDHLPEVPGALEHLTGEGYGRESNPGTIIRELLEPIPNLPKYL